MAGSISRSLSIKFNYIEVSIIKMLKKDGTYSSTHYISQTYFTGQSDQFKLTRIENDPQFKQIKTFIEFDEQEDKKIDAGFYDA